MRGPDPAVSEREADRDLANDEEQRGHDAADPHVAPVDLRVGQQLEDEREEDGLDGEGETISIACAITATPGPTTCSTPAAAAIAALRSSETRRRKPVPSTIVIDRKRSHEALDAATPVTPAMKPVPGRCACTSISWIALAAWSPRRLRSCA